MRGDRVMGSTYSNVPVGRMDPAETLALIEFLEANRLKREAEKAS